MSELIDRQALLDSVYKNLPMIPSMAGMTAEEMRLRIAVLIENAPTDSPWHRVEEELPNDTRDVLAVRRYGNDLEKQEVIVAHLSVIMDMKRGFDKWWNATNITHWMPFPEPPKEDA